MADIEDKCNPFSLGLSRSERDFRFDQGYMHGWNANTGIRAFDGGESDVSGSEHPSETRFLLILRL